MSTVALGRGSPPILQAAGLVIWIAVPVSPAEHVVESDSIVACRRRYLVLADCELGCRPEKSSNLVEYVQALVIQLMSLVESFEPHSGLIARSQTEKSDSVEAHYAIHSRL